MEANKMRERSVISDQDYLKLKSVLEEIAPSSARLLDQFRNEVDSVPELYSKLTAYFKKPDINERFDEKDRTEYKQSLQSTAEKLARNTEGIIAAFIQAITKERNESKAQALTLRKKIDDLNTKIQESERTLARYRAAGIDDPELLKEYKNAYETLKRLSEEDEMPDIKPVTFDGLDEIIRQYRKA